MKFLPANKTLLGFSLCIVLILFVGFSAYLTINRYDENSGWVNHTYLVMSTIDELDRQIVTVESAGRAFILSGDDRFLAAYSGASQRVEFLTERVRELTIDNPVQTRRIDSLRGMIAERIQEVRSGVQIRQKGTTQDVLQQTNMDRARQLSVVISQTFDAMRDEERNLLSARAESMDLSRAYAFFADWGGTLINLVVVLVMLWYITRTFNERKLAEERLKETNIDLEKASGENQRRNWILSGASSLNGGLRGNMPLEQLGDEVISELCRYVGASVGAFYVLNPEKNVLEYKGGYALGKDGAVRRQIVLKEGLLGQAAHEKKMLTLSDVPENYLRIGSALGDMPPHHITALPIEHEEGIKAVLELGTQEALSPERLDYLRFVNRDIGVAIHASQAVERMNVLNEQLQQQAERLQLQQEELQASNEELLRQSEQLQASEEELKVQQEELQQTNAELEEKAQQLKEKNDTLEIARLEIMNKAEEVERNSRYKSEFLANMSHELRTPLNSILILAKLLSENKAANLSDKQVEYASVIYKSGQDLLTLINDVLDLSKIEAGKTTISIAAIPISSIRTDVIALFKEVASSKKIEFSAYIDPNCPTEIFTDKDRVEQIIRNLLSNAFKFTHEGGKVRLGMELVNPRTQPLRSALLLGYSQVLALHVTDNGIGIPKSKQEIIFEAFQQADGSTNRKYGGTGLGLSISRQLAAMLGGELRLESVEGEGSTFTLYLPVVHATHNVDAPPAAAPAPSAVAAPPPSEGGASTHGRIVLIVEDDPAFAEILKDFAREKGYEPVVANRGDVALEYAEQYQPGAIILDIQLPVMDGWEVLRRLKASAITRTIPVHIVSGHGTREKGMELGAIDFLQKPLQKEALDAVFESISRYDNPMVKKVLIVEDDAVQQEHLDRILKESERDIICVTASSGDQAIKRISEDFYDCVILDLTLPDMSGFTLLEHLEKAGLRNKTKVIVYTSRDIAKEDELRLRKFTDTIVLKSGRSHERLLDEIALFLHKVEQKSAVAAGVPFWTGQAGDDVLKGKRVLLVDDDMRNVFALSATLQMHGLDIIMAGDGKEGLQKLSENPDIDIVLMDIMMPEMDGYEAMRRIRENKAYFRLPIIALTAKAMKEDREKCIEAGASDYITKPVDTDQLLSLMRVWLYGSN